MKHALIYSKIFGLVISSLALGSGLQAQNSSSGIRLLATDPTALVGVSGGAFTLVRHGDTNTTLTVTVDISGTAANGVDYTQLGTVFTLAPGDLALDIPVQPLLDTANRGNKTVVLTVESNAAYRVFGNPSATVKIVDDLFDIPPPTVTLSSPTNGSVFTTPATITLQADVSDPDLPIASVSFYADDTFLGKVTGKPYSLTLRNPRTGHYSLFVRATDEFGKWAVSEPVDITVSDVPVVTLVTDAPIYSQGQVAVLQAQIGDPNEAIKSVSFYVNSKLVGTATSAPFTLNWQTSTLGIFSLQAVAVDKNTGKKGTSAKVQAIVVPSSGGDT